MVCKKYFAVSARLLVILANDYSQNLVAPDLEARHSLINIHLLSIYLCHVPCNYAAYNYMSRAPSCTQYPSSVTTIAAENRTK